VFGYDANGNVIREVTELGETTWSYDPLDRPLRRDTGSNWTTWSWDTAARGRGRLGLVSSNTAIHSIGEYDLLGRALQERTVSEPYLAPRTFDFQNQYDPLGQLRTRTYPNGRTLEWVRDPRGFLKEIRSGSIVYADLLDWDARGRLSTWRSGRQAITTQGFDPETGLLESIVVAHPTAGPLLQRAYGHDPGDRIVDVTDGGSAAGTRRYEYDPLGRLTLAERPASGGLPAVRLHYGYDALGNLLCKDAPTPPSSGSCTGLALTYPSGGGLRSRPHLPLTVGGLPAARDDAGNLIGVGSRSFSYNALGQLMEMRESSALRASFEYGPQGALFGISETMGTGSQGRRWRIAEDFDWNTSAVANIHVALGGGIVATHAEPFTPPGGSGGGCAGVGPVLLGSTAGPGGAAAAAGELLALFAPGLLALLLAQLAGSRRRRRAMLVLLARARRPATALATAGSFVAVVVVPVGHEPFSGRAQALASAGLVFYHADHLGSAVVVHTDTLSFQHAAYEPFGQSAGTAAVPEFGFTGQRFVARTGLYHYGARWYDPAMGRFLQPDPLVPEPFDPQSLNRYSYVLNDPVNRVDPTGLQPVSSTEIIPLPDGLTITKTLTLEIGGGAPIPPFNPNLLGDTVGRMVLNATLFSFTPAFEHGLGGRTAADFSAGCGGNAGCLSVAASMQQTVRNRANFFSAVTFAILMVAPLGAEIGATRTGIAGSGATRGPGGALPGQIGRTGEDFLHRAFGGRPASFETSQGRRFVDSFAGGVARESKVGRVSMSPRLRSQISKDLDLLQTRQIDAAEFHFFRSPVTGRGGPTPSVERLLKDCGIGCVIHE
jgi:RHS repeat-associated protein